MSNKIKMVLALVVMLSLAGSAKAYTYSWCVSSGNWADPARWDVLPSPTLVGQALIYNGAVLDVTTPGQGAFNCIVGYTTGGATVNVAEGINWTVSYFLVVGNADKGTINVNGTATTGTLDMSASSAANGSAINVYNGGTLNITGQPGYLLNVNVGNVGTAAINLNGSGNMVISGAGAIISLYDGRGHIDIEAGQLKVKGDYRTQLQGYINNHWITGYDGTGAVNVALGTGADTGYTVVTAAIVAAINPNPPDGATEVAKTTVLSWQSGAYAADVNGHDVYLGTAQNSVNDANHSSAEYKGRQSSTTFNPGTLLAFGHTYYWRIDEVNGVNVWKGSVWSFTVAYCSVSVYFDNEDGDQKWGTAINWDNNTVPDINLGSGVYLGSLGYSTAAVIIDGNQPCANCALLCVGYNTIGQLDVVAGGQLGTTIGTPATTFVGGHPGGSSTCSGVVNIDGAGSVAKSECWIVGGGEHAGTGIINITNGGRLEAGGSGTFIGTDSNNPNGPGGTGIVYIFNGTMHISGNGSLGLTMGTGGLIDLGGGSSVLTLDSDQTTLINGLVASGKIRGCGTAGDVAVVYDPGLNQTIVTAKCSVFLPGDINKDCYVDMKDFAVLADNWLN